MSDEMYYVRWRGEMEGPFSLDQMKEQVAQERVSRLHDVSTDQAQWARAETLEDLFPPFELVAQPRMVGGSAGTAESGPPTGEEVDGGPAESEKHWYCALDGEVRGPFPTQVIAEFVGGGRLKANEFVNDSVDPESWRLIGDVPEFAAAVAAEGGSTVGEGGSESAAAAGDEVAAKKETSGVGRAEASLVLGIVGLIVPICGIIGLILATRARRAIRKRADREGMGMATAGFVLGIIDTCLDVPRLFMLIPIIASVVVAAIDA